MGRQRARILSVTNSCKRYTAIQGCPHRRVLSLCVLNDMSLLPLSSHTDSLLVYAQRNNERTHPNEKFIQLLFHY